MNKLFLILLLALGFIHRASAGLQHDDALFPATSSSDWIGRVRIASGHTLQNPVNGLLYTYYNVKIYSFYKGDTLSLPFMIHGGKLGNVMQRSSVEYYPAEGEILLLFARVTHDFRGEKVWRPVYAQAGIFHEGFIDYSGNVALNRTIMQQHDSVLSAQGMLPVSVSPIPQPASSKSLVFIRSMSPLDIHAGTGEILTIDGFGFGDFFVPGYLSFRDANKGGMQYFSCPAQSVVSWNDKQIRVKVPAGAGSGPVIVDNGSNAATSSTSLNIPWGLINTGNPDPVFLANAVKKNNNGGYEFFMNNRFFQSTENKLAFERALQTWRCRSLVNFTLKGQTEINGTASDEKNVVSWDDQNQLDPGVIGLCYCYYSSCEQGKWYLDELDLLFRENLAWHTGADAPSALNYDFETVALHELGHGQQLSHVNTQNDLMYYSLAKGQARKAPGDFNLEAVDEWFRVSDTWNACSLARMQRIPASVCSDMDFGFYEPAVYPNPFAEILNMDFFLDSAGQINIQLFDLRGRRILSFSETAETAGKYSYRLDPRNFVVNAGIYLLRIDAPGYSKTQKIISY